MIFFLACTEADSAKDPSETGSTDSEDSAVETDSAVDSDSGDSDDSAVDTEDSGADSDSGDSGDSGDTGVDTDDSGDSGDSEDSAVDTVDTGDSGDSGDTGDSGDSGVDTDEPVDTSVDTETSVDARIGAVFSFRFSDATVVAPAGFGSVLSAYLSSDVEVTVVDIVGDALSLELHDTAVTSGGDFEGDISGDPDFTSSCSAMPFDFSGVSGTWENATFSGELRSDATGVDAGVFTADLHTAGISSGILGSPEALCELVTSFGESCGACADGSMLCLYFEFEDIQAR